MFNLFKRFGKVRAVEDATFEVKDGEYLCILGSTGSGKTTLLRLIAGILRPDDGEIRVNGISVNEIPPESRNIVYVPQTYALFPHMTALDNVMFGPIARQMPYEEAKAKALNFLKLVKLDHRADAYPSELSGGMQQRIALARGLASGAKTLLLDEPLGALDARLRIELRVQLKNLAKESDLTVIHVTHDQEEAMSIADRMLIIRNGRVQQHGTPYHIYKKPENLFIANFIGRTNFLEGIVDSKDQEKTTVRLRQNLCINVSDISHEREEAIIVAVREENTNLLFNGAWAEMNVLDGDIIHVSFLGCFIRFEIKLTNRDTVFSLMPINNSTRSLKVGDKVKLTINPKNTILYDYPPLGLRHELEVY